MKNLEKKDRAKIAPSYKQRHKPKPKIVRNSGFALFFIVLHYRAYVTEYTYNFEIHFSQLFSVFFEMKKTDHFKKQSISLQLTFT